jgi:hypothetical protein
MISTCKFSPLRYLGGSRMDLAAVRFEVESPQAPAEGEVAVERVHLLVEHDHPTVATFVKPPLIITVNKATTAADLHHAVTASLRRFLPLPEPSLVDDLTNYSLGEEEGSEMDDFPWYSSNELNGPASKKFKSPQPHFHIQKKISVKKTSWGPDYEIFPESEEIVFNKFGKICTFWNREVFLEGKFLEKMSAVTLSLLFLFLCFLGLVVSSSR